MTEEKFTPSPPASRSRLLALILIVAMLLGAGLWIFERVLKTPGQLLKSSAEVVREMGGQAATVARAFRTGTMREEFLSHTNSLTGTTRLQVATTKQMETFRREEAGEIAWGLIPLPKVVVQAQAPVEYSYYLDLQAPWDFRQEKKTILVHAPPLEPNTPAIDVSALTFYTLAGGIWPHEKEVRERLRINLTGTLRQRARDHGGLVREVARQQVAGFVEQWLGGKFGDARDYRIKVVFPDESPDSAAEKPPL